MPRDTQRKRVYDAEREAAVQHSGHHFKQTIPTHYLQAWVDDVLARPAVRRRWGEVSTTVELTHGGGRSFGGLIVLGTGARNPWYILHEIAHELLWHKGYAAHGPEFAGVNLWLVRTVMGAEAGKALVAAHRKHRVRRNTKGIPAPTRPIVTEQQRRERQRKVAAAPVRQADREAAAKTIRRLVTQGHFGPAGRKPRDHALATARALEQDARRT